MAEFEGTHQNFGKHTNFLTYPDLDEMLNSVQRSGRLYKDSILQISLCRAGVDNASHGGPVCMQVFVSTNY